MGCNKLTYQNFSFLELVHSEKSASEEKNRISVLEYVYQYKDHLNNVRLTYSDSNNDGSIDANTEIISEKNYYPFGLAHRGYNNVVSANANSVAEKFGFGNKELNDELGLDWYDITARNYDPALGRWMNLDPLAEKMRRHSPYNFGFDNPVYFQDYDGMMPTGTNCCGNDKNPFNWGDVLPGLPEELFKISPGTQKLIDQALNEFSEVLDVDLSVEAEAKFGLKGKVKAGPVSGEVDLAWASVKVETEGTNIKATGKAVHVEGKLAIGDVDNENNPSLSGSYTMAEGTIELNTDDMSVTTEGDTHIISEPELTDGTVELKDTMTVGVGGKVGPVKGKAEVDFYQMVKGTGTLLKAGASFFADMLGLQ